MKRGRREAEKKVMANETHLGSALGWWRFANGSEDTGLTSRSFSAIGLGKIYCDFRCQRCVPTRREEVMGYRLCSSSDSGGWRRR